MRIIVLAAGTDPEADPARPYRMRALTEGPDGAAHEVELRARVWTCTCGGGCEHIAAVKPLAGQETAAPVADRPATLPAEDARELAYLGVGQGFDGWTVVADDEVDHSRWESHHQLVIRDADGRHYAAPYSQGLTEYQDTRPWEDQKTVTFHPVAPRSKVVHVVEWVAPEQSAQ